MEQSGDEGADVAHPALPAETSAVLTVLAAVGPVSTDVLAQVLDVDPVVAVAALIPAERRGYVQARAGTVRVCAGAPVLPLLEAAPADLVAHWREHARAAGRQAS